MKKKQKKKLTIKQQIFVKETVRTKNPKKAAIIAYELGSKQGSKTKEDMENVASVMAYENLNKPLIKEAIGKLLERTGITKEKLTLIHNDLLESIDERIRLAAMVEAHKLMDNYPSAKIKIGRLEEIEGVFTETDLEDITLLKEENTFLKQKIGDLEAELAEKK